MGNDAAVSRGTVASVVVALSDERQRHVVATTIRGAADLELAGEVGSGGAALATVADLTPDVLLLDLDLPPGDGDDALTLSRTIAVGAPAVRTVLVTDDADRALGAVTGGAVGCVAAASLGDEVLEVVRRVSWGEALVPAAWAGAILAAVDRWDGPPTVPAPVLSATEVDILRRLASGGSPAAIADADEVTARAVNRHVADALSKVQQAHRDRTDLDGRTSA